MEEVDKIMAFLQVDEFPSGSGYGDGYDDGDGYGDGYDDGDGYGDGSGYGDDDGSGDGYGDDDGSGYGYGDGYGDGSGYGDGYDDGSGYGDGYGSKIKSIDDQKVFDIDCVPTIVSQAAGQYAKGFILNGDLTRTPCYIAKCGNFFAHGETLKDAFRDAREKYEENAPLEERIARFNALFPDNDKPVSGRELFSWHHILTGSCLMGREQFCRERGLDIDAEYTVAEFIRLTEHAYGSDAIKKLKESRGI